MKRVFYLLPLSVCTVMLSSCGSSNHYLYKSTFVETYVLSQDSVVEDSFQIEESITAANKEEAFMQAYRNSCLYYIEESARVKNGNGFRMVDVNLFNGRGKNITQSVKLHDGENRQKQIWDGIYNSIARLPEMEDNQRIKSLQQPVLEN